MFKVVHKPFFTPIPIIRYYYTYYFYAFISDTLLLSPIKNNQLDQTILLVQLSQHIPKTFKNHRADLICIVMNCIFTTNYEVSEVKQLLIEVDGLPAITKELCGKPPERILWEVHKSMLKYLCTRFLCTYVHTYYSGTLALSWTPLGKTFVLYKEVSFIQG